MNPSTPELTLQQIEALPSTKKATMLSQGYSIAASELPEADGPLVSKRILFTEGEKKLVYEFYRARNEENKIYIIF